MTELPPQNGESEAGGPAAGVPQTGGPQNSGPQNGGPQNGGPQNGGPQNGGPQNGGPQTGGPQPGPPYGGPASGPAYGAPPFGAPGFPPMPAAVPWPDGSAVVPRPVTGRPDFAEAFRFSWKSFGRYPWPMMVPGLLILVASVLGVVLAVVGFIWMFGSALSSTADSTAETSINVGGLVLAIVAILVLALVTTYFQGGLLSGLLTLTDGRPVTARDFVGPSRPGAFLVTAILIGLATVVGMILLIIPGFLAAVAFQYAPVMVLEQKMSPIAAMRASAKLAFAHFGDSVVVWILRAVYGYVGSFVFIVGSMVTMPMGEAFLIHCYRDLTDRPVPSYV